MCLTLQDRLSNIEKNGNSSDTKAAVFMAADQFLDEATKVISVRRINKSKRRRFTPSENKSELVINRWHDQAVPPSAQRSFYLLVCFFPCLFCHYIISILPLFYFVCFEDSIQTGVNFHFRGFNYRKVSNIHPGCIYFQPPVRKGVCLITSAV